MTETILTDTPKQSSDRSFGIVIGIALIVFAVLFRRHEIIAFILLLTAATLFLTAALYPKILYKPKLAWLAFGAILHKIINPLILLVIYVTLIVPIGLIMQIFRDPLNRKGTRQAGSYWKTVDDPDYSPDMRRQF